MFDTPLPAEESSAVHEAFSIKRSQSAKSKLTLGEIVSTLTGSTCGNEMLARPAALPTLCTSPRRTPSLSSSSGEYPAEKCLRDSAAGGAETFRPPKACSSDSAGNRSLNSHQKDESRANRSSPPRETEGGFRKDVTDSSEEGEDEIKVRTSIESSIRKTRESHRRE